MGCQSDVILENNLTFSITTHDPDTGVLTDADSPPSYRVYEDETATPILTGSMATLDGGSTTGFYTELIACTAANGFEVGKSYTIYIEATVDSDTGGIAFSFTVSGGDAFATTEAEPAKGSPAATTTLAAKINYLYKAWRNRATQTAATYSLYDDAGTTVDQQATVSDDGTTATKGEIVTGP